MSTFAVWVQQFVRNYYTCTGLCIGSVFEEECSEMWYALWIVRFRESIEIWTHNVLSEYIWTCVCLSGDKVCAGNAGSEYVSVVTLMKCQPIDKPLLLAMHLITKIYMYGCIQLGALRVEWSKLDLYMWTWGQVCTPAEFKHIDKRRKTHNAERLQSLRMNED